MLEEAQRLLRQFILVLPEAAVSRLLSKVESHSIPIHSLADRRKGGQFGRKLNRLQPYGHRLACAPIYRNAFLWGVANYLRGLPHEELVIGFGVGQSSRTRVDSVLKIRGEANRVQLPAESNVLIHGFLDQDEKHTAILVHNHPENNPLLCLLETVLGSEPMPSMADRDASVAAWLLRIERRISGFAFGRIRFFVIQNDRILEFSGFTAALVLDFIRMAWKLSRRQNAARGASGG